MTKKERVIAAIEGREPDKIPSGFSLHFPKEIAFGDAAVDAHIRFFEESDTDSQSHDGSPPYKEPGSHS